MQTLPDRELLHHVTPYGLLYVTPEALFDGSRITDQGQLTFAGIQRI